MVRCRARKVMANLLDLGIKVNSFKRLFGRMEPTKVSNVLLNLFLVFERTRMLVVRVIGLFKLIWFDSRTPVSLLCVTLPVSRIPGRLNGPMCRMVFTIVAVSL